MDLLLMFFTNPIAPVVVLVVVIIIYILVIRNRFVRLDNKVKQDDINNIEEQIKK